MGDGHWFKTIRKKLSEDGLNICAIVSGEQYDHILPGCRSVAVFANGGTVLWDHFIRDLKSNPEHLKAYVHPFDQFVQRLVLDSDPSPPDSRKWVMCAAEADVFLDFRVLGLEAGLAENSLMGMLIHPKYGLWMGLRAALLTTEDLSEFSETTQKNDICASCEDKPCILACPAQAVSIQGWDVELCARQHRVDVTCHGICHSRRRCPVGEEHRHGTLQHHYHNARETGRRALAQFLSIDDSLLGIGPGWSDWE
ncbi:MAG: hypothetical protein CMK59_14085 [Proteobacteria bacterium]|nr:hypothetical protein [Pseudomonadota bacterium]